KANIAFAKKTLERIWDAADAEETFAIDRYAHLVGGCRMGFGPEDSVVDSSSCRGGAEPVHRRRQRPADGGGGEPRARDHGALRPARDAACTEAYDVDAAGQAGEGGGALSRGEVVVVTGATSGVGRAVAERFARDGARIALLARGQRGLEGTARAVEGLGGTALQLATDVADDEAVEAAASTAEEQLGEIDIWINNAMTTVFA